MPKGNQKVQQRFTRRCCLDIRPTRSIGQGVFQDDAHLLLMFFRQRFGVVGKNLQETMENLWETMGFTGLPQNVPGTCRPLRVLSLKPMVGECEAPICCFPSNKKLAHC